jgi:amino acid adenylation domain-containing protein
MEMEREALESEESVGFWEEMLSGYSVTPVPLGSGDRGRRVGESAHKGFALEASVEEGLRRVGALAGTPIKTVLLAVHLKALSLLTGSSDITTGVVVNVRPEVEDGDRVLGLFLNTLPLRMKVKRGSWIELVRATLAVEQEVNAHRRYPMAMIKQRYSAGQKLFETGFNYTHFHIYKELPDSGTVTGRSGFALNDFPYVTRFQTQPGGTQLLGEIAYDRRLVSESDGHRIVGHFRRIFKAMVESPESCHVSSELLLPSERHQVAVEWNRTERDYGTHRSVQELFEEQAERTPNRVAIVCGEESVVYADLNRRANQMAHYLTKQGVAPEVLVGLCLENSVEMMIALLGILKAGGVYVSLDPRLPSARMSLLVKQSGIAVLVAHRDVLKDISAPGTTAVDMEVDRRFISVESEEYPTPALQPENLAYALFTSGSTGQPRGVAIEHRQLRNYLAGVMERLDLRSIANFVLVQPLSVDASVTTIFPPLLTGGTLHIIPREMSLDAHALAGYFKQNNVEYFKCAPSYLAALHAAAGEELLPSRCLILGGEGGPWEWLARIRKNAAGNCSFFNQYGPTETTVGVLVHRIERHTEQQSPITLLGRPLSNTRVYILDKFAELVPVGAPGELYVGGANVARGYWNSSDLTAEKFVPDPFGPERSQRLYRTGDLCRYLPTGDIEFLGRLDGQIKIRGYRVEPREIEAQLAQHESVGQCAVAARENPQGQSVLVAYMVGRSKVSLGAEQLQAYLKEYLPEYMVPNYFVWLQEMPLSRHGKLDTNQLPKPELEHERLEMDYVEPRTALEKSLAGIWAEVLGLERVGMRDDFFELGGHSLLAMKMASRVRKMFSIELPLRLIFETPRLEDITAALLRDNGEQLESYAEMLAKVADLSDEEAETLVLDDLGVRQKEQPNG